MEEYSCCTLCPRICKVNRSEHPGFCGCGADLKAARAALHFWEEPCLSSGGGSGTVFFSGCSLKCCFCQNYSLSHENFGKVISSVHLADIFLQLQDKGANNINLVTPTQWLPDIISALKTARQNGLRLPIVYNTGGYETVETVQRLKEYVDIWLTDLKYCSSDLSLKFSGAADYFSVSSAALDQMICQTGSPVFSSAGILQKGVIVRLLVLPSHVRDSFDILDHLAALPKNSFLLSLMSQYTPFYHAFQYKELSRRITSYEYNKVLDYAVKLGLTNGFMQRRSSAKEEYTPDFDLTGL